MMRISDGVLVLTGFGRLCGLCGAGGHAPNGVRILHPERRLAALKAALQWLS